MIVPLLFIVLCSTSIFSVAFFKRRFESALHFSFLGMLPILYTFGIINQLLLGVYFVNLLVCALYISSIIKIVKDKSYRESFSNFFTPAFFVFVILYSICFYTTYKMEAFGWDEFSHWCDTVKIMYTTDALGTDLTYFPSYPHYPPGVSLLQYYVLKIKGNFVQWTIFFVQKVFVVSLIIPFMDFNIKSAQIGKRFRETDNNEDLKYNKLIDLIKIFFIPIFLFFNFMIFQPDFYNSAYIDSLLGIMFGFTIANMFIFNIRKIEIFVSTLLGVFALCIIKEAGTTFAVATVIIMTIEFLKYHIHNKNEISKNLDLLEDEKNNLILKNNKSTIMFLCGTLFSCIYPLMSWSQVVKINNITQVSDRSFSFSELINLGSTPETAYRLESVENFKNHFYGVKVLEDSLNTTHFMIFVVCFLITALFIGYYYYKEKNIENINEKKYTINTKLVVSIGMFLTFIIYTVGLLISYLFFFSEYDALRLASMDRYLFILYAGFMMFISANIVYIIENEKNIKIKLLCFLAIIGSFASLDNEVFMDTMKRSTVRLSIRYNEYLGNVSKEFEKHQNPDSSERVLIVDQNTSGMNVRKMKYFIRPDNVTFTYWHSFGKPYSDADIWTYDYTAEDWVDFVYRHFDYMIIINVDEQFIENYSSVFEEPEEIRNGAIFSVDMGNQQIKCLGQTL